MSSRDRNIRSTSSKRLLDAYMRDLRKTKMLPLEEELELARSGNKKELVTANLRYVVSVAHRHSTSDTDLLERIQDGNLGLSYSIHNYDPKRNCKVISYTDPWIRLHQQTRVNRLDTTPLTQEHYDTIQDPLERPDLVTEKYEYQTKVQEHLDTVLQDFSPREIDLVKNHIMGEEKVNLAEFARKYDISRERARQIEARVLAKLKEKFTPVIAQWRGY